MGCPEKTKVWKRAWRGVLTSPRGVLLAAAGAGTFWAGIVLRSNTLGLPLIVLGAGGLTLGLILPLVGEAEIGPGGFKLKLVKAERDSQFTPSTTPEQQESLQRFVTLLSGDLKRAPELVAEALERTYTVWNRIQEEDRRAHIICTLVRLVIGASAVGMFEGHIPGHEGTTQALLSLDLRARAIVLLHHFEDIGEEDIAKVLDMPTEAVRRELHEAETRVASIPEPTGAGS
jgi:hypothetical protein